MRQSLFAVALIVLVASSASAQRAPMKRLIVHPQDILLDGPRAEQRIGVIGERTDGTRFDFSPIAKIRSANRKVATVHANRIVRPVADGKTTLTISAGALTATVEVEVKNAKKDVLVSFTREIVPILTRFGCNQGACHGAQHGKGGFKLSLLGFDAAFDHKQIVQSAEGRRIVLSEPERSIILLKPTMTLEHVGKKRFSVGGREYERILRWLEDGAPEPNRKDPHVTSLEVWPRMRVMILTETQQILVRATWSDGKREDVTATAQFDALNDAVASVTPSGLIQAKGKGETHVMVRFGGQVGVVQITLPYSRRYNGMTAKHWQRETRFSPHNFIDEKLAVKWRALGLTPSPTCSDEEFYRRIHLDAIGTLPTPKSVLAFLADKSSDKRKRAIDAVLNRPEFVDFWALKFGDLLKINRRSLQDRGMWSFHNWVRAHLRDGKPIDEMARDIITAEGSTFTEGPANYYLTARTPAEWAETTSQVFLGVRIGCAKCHHHPFEKWSQDDYYGMTAFFVRLGQKNSQEFGLFGREKVVYLKNSGEQRHPRKGGTVKPHPLDGKDMDDPLDRRVQLAKWLTATDNPFFARNMVNRFWGYTMGRGLVEPLDDMRATNPATNPELLDALAADFIKHKYDLKHLLRLIMNSRAYQLSARATKDNRMDAGNVHYTRFRVRRLTAEQLADAVDFATGTQTKYPGLPLGTRAISLPDSEVKSFFLDVFGKPARKITCECERTTQPNIAQALHLLNGDFLNKKIGDPKGRIAKLLKAKKKQPEIIRELYLHVLSRPPRPHEIRRAEKWIADAPNPREGIQDVMWALLNSREFLFNH